MIQKVFFILFLLGLSLNSFAQSEFSDNTIYTFCDELAMYSKGDDQLIMFLNENLKFKPNSINEIDCTKVIISFIIEKDGTTSNHHFQKPTQLLNIEEVKRVFRLLDKFKAGKINGAVVRSLYSIPMFISFE